MMPKVTYILIAALMLSCAVPAFADVMEQTPVSSDEDGDLTQQQSDDAQRVSQVEGGDATEVWAAVGIVLVVLIVASAIAA